MAEYRVPEFTLEQRAEVAMQMLVPLPERRWGLVSELARRYAVSRTSLYEIRDRALAGLVGALPARDAGRPAQSTTLTVDKVFIDRTIAILPLLKGSVRDIRLGLNLLFGATRSVGYISQTLTDAGERATAYNQGITVPLPVLGEADEIFQGRKPCLTLVDGRSFLVLKLTPAESRDGTTWGLTFLDLVERGIQFHDLACDGGTGLRAGVKEAELAIPLRPDLFHILQEAHRLYKRPIASPGGWKERPTGPLTPPSAPDGLTWSNGASFVDGVHASRSKSPCLGRRSRKRRPLRPSTPGVGFLAKSARLWSPSRQLTTSSRSQRRKPLLRLRWTC
jgi:hypothetical protein